MKITITDGYVSTLGAGTDVGGETAIAITTALASKPTTENGYGCKLRADNFEWELYELPEPEPIDEEATTEDYEAALAELGVK